MDWTNRLAQTGQHLQSKRDPVCSILDYDKTASRTILAESNKSAK